MELRERVRDLAGVPPLSDVSAEQLRELESALAHAESIDDLPGKWQAAVVEAELRAAGDDVAGGHGHCCHA